MSNYYRCVPLEVSPKSHSTGVSERFNVMVNDAQIEYDRISLSLSLIGSRLIVPACSRICPTADRFGFDLPLKPLIINDHKWNMINRSKSKFDPLIDH